MWFVLAVLSAFCAAAVAVFSKLISSKADVYLVTCIKAFLMAITILLASMPTQNMHFTDLLIIETKEWISIILSGILGGLGWLFYFIALEQGTVANVVAVNQWVIIFTLVLSFFMLGENITLIKIIGGVLMILGSYCIVYW